MTDNVTPISPRPALVREFEAELARIGMTLNKCSKQLRISSSALSQWRLGKYPGDNAAIEVAVRRWLDTGDELEGRRLDGAGLDRHVDLSVTGEISSLLAHAQATADVVLIKGASGMGKTWAARRYTEQRTGAYMVTARPDTRTMNGMLGEIADEIGATGDRSSAMKSAGTVIATLRDRSALLMVDEAHHLRPSLLDELRCIRDTAVCGLGLIGDETIEMPLGRLPQLVGRIGGRFSRRSPSEHDVELLMSCFLERPARKREVALAIAAARGAGGLHALRRVLARAWMLAKIDEREVISPEDLAAACGEAPDAAPESPAEREARA